MFLGPPHRGNMGESVFESILAHMDDETGYEDGGSEYYEAEQYNLLCCVDGGQIDRVQTSKGHGTDDKEK
jgi:hypothetical protein